METLGWRRVRGKKNPPARKAEVVRSIAWSGNASGLSGSQTLTCTGVT